MRRVLAYWWLWCVAGCTAWAAEPPRLPSGIPSSFQKPVSGLGLEDAFSFRFEQPIGIVSPPNDEKLFIVERKGRIAVVPDLNQPEKRVFLDLTGSTVNFYEETGLLGVAFHPNYERNGYFYVYRTTLGEDGQTFCNQLSRFEVSGEDALRGEPDSEVILIQQPDTDYHHNGGDLHFGPDGYLYLTIGYGLAPPEYRSPENPIAIDKAFFGSMLRIDVDQRPGNLPPNPGLGVMANYLVPADNPWVGAEYFMGRRLDPAKVRTELYAVGLRQTYRFSFDSATGKIYAGDVGERSWEEANRIRKGGNYGFPLFEGGTQIGQIPPGFVPDPPLYSYSHGTQGPDVGSAIVGGYVPRGSDIPELDGHYIFGDFVSGNIWKMATDGSSVEWIAREMAVSAFGRNPRDGSILIANVGSGAIRRLRKTEPAQSDVPGTLAETGLFADLAALTPAAGLMPFEINTPFWSDHAIKSRWFGLPQGNERFGFRAEGNWTLPKGSVWVKHFDLELVRGEPSSARRLETRVLFKDESQVWGYTYRWSSPTEATLVAEQGEDEEIEVTEGGVTRVQRWHYPSRGECASCHTAAGGFALGFNTAQLNRPVTHDGQTANQLEWLARSGYLDTPEIDSGSHRKMAHPTDETEPLEHRVKSYLAANCAACHQPEGLALRMRWDARIETPMSQAGIVGALPVISFLDPLVERLVVPRNPSHSLLHSRLASNDSFLMRMPPLSTSEQNAGALELLREWIGGLPTGPLLPAQVGANPLEGSLHDKDGKLVMGGTGSPLQGSDSGSFTVARKTMAGNFQIVAQVGAWRGGTERTEAGLALLGGTNATDRGIWLTRRGGANEVIATELTGERVSLGRSGEPTSLPWQRLARQEDRISAWESEDGLNWRLLNEIETELPAAVDAGIFVTSGDPWRYAMAEFDAVTMMGVRTEVENPAPNGGIRLTAALEGDVEEVRSVSFFADDVLLGTAEAAPWRLGWTNAWLEEFVVRSVATDQSGLSVTSAPVRVKYAAQAALARHVRTAPVTANWTSEIGRLGYTLPWHGAALPERFSVELEGAQAQSFAEPSLIEGPAGPVMASAWTGVDRFIIRHRPASDAPHKLTLFFAPYGGANSLEVIINDPTTGETLDRRTIRGFELGTFESWVARGALEIIVQGDAPSPPTLSGIFLDALPPPEARILPPASPIALPGPFTLKAEASAEGREIRRVEFWDGETKLGEDIEAPFEIAWDPVAGEHTLRAWAIGDYGLGAFSEAVTVQCDLPASSARFVGEDRKTQGDWIGAYGALGNVALGGWTNLPPTISMSASDAGVFVFSYYETDRAALRRSLGDPLRLAGCYYSILPEGMLLRVSALDGKPASLSIYSLDYLGGGREQEFFVYDSNTGVELDQRKIGSFHGGTHLVWNFQGELKILVRSTNPQNAVVSGIFVDAPETAAGFWWRQHFNGTPSAPERWLEDPDGDGRANLLEYAAGTDPLSEDAPILENVRWSYGAVELTLNVGATPADARLVLETSWDLENWVTADVEQVSGPSPLIVRTDGTSEGGQFFRLRAEVIP